MDPTSNSAPIFSSGGAAPSGTGDIVLSPTPAPAGKSKKGIVAVIIILIVLIFGGLGAWYLLSGNFKSTENDKFYDMVEKSNYDSIKAFISSVADVYDKSFDIQTAKRVNGIADDIIAELEEGIAGLNKINEGVEAGQIATGTIVEIDLEKNYSGLKQALSTDMPKYQKIANAMIAILKAANGDKVEADEFNGTAIGDIINLTKQYASSTDGGEISGGEIYSAVMSEIGEIKYRGEGSVIYYLNNIYVAIGEGKNENQ